MWISNKANIIIIYGSAIHVILQYNILIPCFIEVFVLSWWAFVNILHCLVFCGSGILVLCGGMVVLCGMVVISAMLVVCCGSVVV